MVRTVAVAVPDLNRSVSVWQVVMTGSEWVLRCLLQFKYREL